MLANHKPALFGLMTVLAVGLALSVSCQALGATYQYKGAVLDPPAPLPDFELLGTGGQPFHLSDVEGDIALIYFGYTYCPDVCPLILPPIKVCKTC